MQDGFAKRLKLLRGEARACLHLANLTAVEAERMRLRRHAARLAMQAELEERQQESAERTWVTGSESCGSLEQHRLAS